MDQDRSEPALPTVISDGDTDMVTAGFAAAVTVNVADAVALPPGPVHVNVYMLTPIVDGVTDLLSGIGSIAPDHEPLSTQAPALLTPHVSVAVLASVIVEGVTETGLSARQAGWFRSRR